MSDKEEDAAPVGDVRHEVESRPQVLHGLVQIEHLQVYCISFHDCISIQRNRSERQRRQLVPKRRYNMLCKHMCNRAVDQNFWGGGEIDHFQGIFRANGGGLGTKLKPELCQMLDIKCKMWPKPQK